jgi:hypothetical protein
MMSLYYSPGVQLMAVNVALAQFLNFRLSRAMRSGCVSSTPRATPTAAGLRIAPRDTGRHEVLSARLRKRNRAGTSAADERQ